MQHSTDSTHLKTSMEEEDLALSDKLRAFQESVLNVEAIEAKYSSKMQNNIKTISRMKKEMKTKIDEDNVKAIVTLGKKWCEVKKVNKVFSEKNTIIKRCVEFVKKQYSETMKELNEARSSCHNNVETKGNEIDLQSSQVNNLSISTNRKVLGDISNVEANINGTRTGRGGKRTSSDARLKNHRATATKKLNVQPNSTLDKEQDVKGFQFTLSDEPSIKGEYLNTTTDSHAHMHFYDELVKYNSALPKHCKNKPTKVNLEGKKSPHTYFPSNINMSELNRFFIAINEKTGWRKSKKGNYVGEHFHEETNVKYLVTMVLKKDDKEPILLTAYPNVEDEKTTNIARYWVVMNEFSL